MDLLTDRSHIPSILNTRPRRVRATTAGGCGPWFIRLFILPHTIAGIALVLIMATYPIWAVFGRDSEARVVNAWTEPASKGMTRYWLEYEDSSGGSTRRKKSIVSRHEFERVGGDDLPGPEGNTYGTVRIRTIGRPPWKGYAGLVESRKGIWKVYFQICLAGVIWNAILSVFAGFAYINPLIKRRLYRSGVPDPGVITGKRSEQSKNGWTYYLDYEFALSDGRRRKSSAQVRESQFSAAAEGQPITVLHPPGKLKPSVPYEFGGYVCR